MFFFASLALAAEPATSTDTAFDRAAKALDQSKQEVQSLKDVWDKARLETTLYDQRAKRAYKGWAAHGARAAKGAREKAEDKKERTELEFQLAVEKRKLAYNLWQEAVLREAAREADLKALDQKKDTESIRDRIGEIEGKLKGPPSATRSSSSGTTKEQKK